MTIRSELIDTIRENIISSLTTVSGTIAVMLLIQEGYIILGIVGICLVVGNIVANIISILQSQRIAILKNELESLQKKNNEVIYKSSENEYKSDRKEQEGI